VGTFTLYRATTTNRYSPPISLAGYGGHICSPYPSITSPSSGTLRSQKPYGFPPSGSPLGSLTVGGTLPSPLRGLGACARTRAYARERARSRTRAHAHAYKD